MAYTLTLVQAIETGKALPLNVVFEQRTVEG